jgi:predicted ABC-type ATPase
MGVTTIRKRKDGFALQMAQILTLQKGATVYQESQTFERKVACEGKCELDIAKPRLRKHIDRCCGQPGA